MVNQVIHDIRNNDPHFLTMNPWGATTPAFTKAQAAGK